MKAVALEALGSLPTCGAFAERRDQARRSHFAVRRAVAPPVTQPEQFAEHALTHGEGMPICGQPVSTLDRRVLSADTSALRRAFPTRSVLGP